MSTPGVNTDGPLSKVRVALAFFGPPTGKRMRTVMALFGMRLTS